MFKFFAALRRMLYASNISQMGLGSLIHQFINEYSIPELKSKFSTARSQAEKDKIKAKIEEYQQYSDPKNPLSHTFDRTAEKVIASIVSRFPKYLDPSYGQDLAQGIAVDFKSGGKRTGKPLEEALKAEIDVMDGPEALNRMWASLIHKRIQWRIRDFLKQNRDDKILKNVKLEDEDKDPLEDSIAPEESKPEDEEYLEVIGRDLYTYVMSKIENSKSDSLSNRDAGKGIFEIWWKMLNKNGPDSISLDKDLYPAAMKKFDISRSSVWHAWTEIKKIMVRYFEKELGKRVSDRVKEKLHISSVEVLAREEFRYQFAKWMLGR